MNTKKITILIASVITSTILLLGYFAFGFYIMLVFSSGFLTGLLLWIIFPFHASYQEIRKTFFLTLILFLIHRVEEKYSNFFQALSHITNTPTPEILSWSVVLLVVLSVGGWLSIPYLLKRNLELGRYLIWTFFAAMRITELAHILVFPIIINKPFEYFPGMASVFVLAPVACRGIFLILKKRRPTDPLSAA